MIGQALAEPEDIATVTAILMCKCKFDTVRGPTYSPLTCHIFAVIQTIGGALLISASQAAFVNTLIAQVLVNSPGIDPALVIAAGATGLHDAFTEAQLPGLLLSYMAALRVAYAVSIATSGAAAFVALLAPWTSIKGKVSLGAA